jgi:hypothetical protein
VFLVVVDSARALAQQSAFGIRLPFHTTFLIIAFSPSAWPSTAREFRRFFVWPVSMFGVLTGRERRPAALQLPVLAALLPGREI